MNHSVYSIIRDRILYLEYEPGQILNEKILAREFGISRTPVRDVLNRLEWDQLVRIIPRTGSMVTEIEFSKIMNAFQVRFELADMEGRLAAEQFTNKHISTLERLCHDCDALLDNKNQKTLSLIDRASKNIILEAAGNPVLTEVSDRLYAQTCRLWHLVMDKGDWNKEVLAVQGELENLLKIISNGTAMELGKERKTALVRHLERLRDKFIRL